MGMSRWRDADESAIAMFTWKSWWRTIEATKEKVPAPPSGRIRNSTIFFLPNWSSSRSSAESMRRTSALAKSRRRA